MSESKKSTRDKIERHFNSEKAKNHKSKDLEDSEDIYSHTKSFFKDIKEDKDIEVGVRKIKGQINDEEYDEKVYSVKKTTRSQLLEVVPDDESIDSDEVGDDSEFKYGSEDEDD